MRGENFGAPIWVPERRNSERRFGGWFEQGNGREISTVRQLRNKPRGILTSLNVFPGCW